MVSSGQKVEMPKNVYNMTPAALAKEISKLKKQMKKASDKLEFEEAANLRDEIKRLELVELGARPAQVLGDDGDAS